MRAFLGIFIALIVLGCSSPKSEEIDDFVLDIPVGFPDPIFPDDNLPTPDRIELGRKLFFDRRLSSTGDVSCVSCHLPGKAFSDFNPKSIGVGNRMGTRNAPTLINLAWGERFMWDGGVPSLELQVLAPVHGELEMDHDITEIASILKKDEEINRMSLAAYGRDIDPFVIIRAIASFERTFISGNSRYDQYINGDSAALTVQEIAGMKLFFSDRTACSSCHSGFNFTDQGFYNIGLNEESEDVGRMLITHEESDRGKFKVPTLRNIEHTRPYMHDGSIKRLNDVLEHFNEGGHGDPNKDPRIRPLGLSMDELNQLEAFLLSLTDDSFLNP